MRINVYPNFKAPRTHEGGPASSHVNAAFLLRRSVMASMLWEDTYYENGQTVADRIAELVPQVPANLVAKVAISARNDMKLRHVPLLLCREMLRHDSHKGLVADLLSEVIQRPDELAEFLAIYWKGQKNPKTPLSAQAKKGLAKAFLKFDEYSLAKYNRATEYTLRDVMFLTHPRPQNATQENLFRRLAMNELTTPDTWEVALSAATDKHAEWARLLSERKLGAMALLRNLRNMQQAGVNIELIRSALLHTKADKVLPYRFIAAARYAPSLEGQLEYMMLRNLEGQTKLPGKTVLLIDVSGSMGDQLSGKSEMKRIDAACGLAVLARELCEEVSVYTFSDRLVQVPSRRGFALRDAIVNSQPHSGTYLSRSLSTLSEPHDRLIVFTDEQSADGIPAPKINKSYCVNVASCRNGVGYGQWTKIDGFSEAIMSYIQMMEQNHAD